MLVVIAGFSLIGGPLAAQTIYPIDRAAILAGARFDFKVEFPAIEKDADLKITINGEDYSRQLGKAGQFVENEVGSTPRPWCCARSASTSPAAIRSWRATARGAARSPGRCL